MFAGVGVGIIVSTLLIALVTTTTSDPATLWLALGAASLACSLVADALLARVDRAVPVSPPRGRRTRLSFELRTLVASYACAGFGYVLTATYLVLIVRDADRGALARGAGVVRRRCVRGGSTWFWARIGDQTGERRALVAAHVALAAGVLSAAFLPGPAGIVIGAVLLGGTFAGITGVGVDLARRLHPVDPTRAIAVMTTAFAIGQMIGPAVGGWLADRTGTFRVPSVVAAAVLLVGAAPPRSRSSAGEPVDARVAA